MTRKYLVYGMVAWLILSCLPLPLAASEHHGQVKFGGVPVPGATVTAAQGDKKLVAVTDPQGVYVFPDLSDGVWTIEVEMLCFSTIKQQVTIAAGAPSPEWELKLLPLNEINAETAAEARAAASPAEAAAAPARSGAPASGRNPADQPAENRRDAGATPPAAAVPARATEASAPRKGSRNAKAEQAAPPANAPSAFQRRDLNASPQNAAATPASPEQESGAFANQSPEELAQRATDGFLVAGSANNSASSPFGLFPAFGNFRKRPGALYNGNIGLIGGNSALDARSFSLTGQDTPQPAYSQLTGVVSFGGPLKIPHVRKMGPNFTVNYQWTRNRSASTHPALMPSPAERNGDFSQTLTPLGRPVAIFDPATGLQFPNNVVPQSRISSQAKALLSLYPLPSFAANTHYNYQIPIVGITHQDALQSRLNKTLGRRNQLSGSFAYQSARTDNPNLFGFLDTGNSAGINTGVNLRHNFTTRLLGNIGYQYSRQTSRTTPFFQNRRNVSGEAGISGNNQEPVNWGPPALSFSSGIAGLSDARPVLTRNQTSGLSYAMSWGRDRHNLSFGADFRRQQFNHLSQQDPRGTFVFTGAATQARTNGLPVAGTGFDFAGFLLGVPDTSSIAFGNADKYFRASVYDAYFTDDFRMSPGFTVNGGMRWEYGSPITELYGRLVNLDIAPGFAAVAPVIAGHPVGSLTGETYPDSLVRPDKRALQPRIGISWRPFLASSLVVRAGYGVYYNTSVYSTIASQMAQQSPLSKSLSVQNSPGNPLTLANGFHGSPSTTANTFAIDPNFRVGYAQNWQVSVQRDLPGALVMNATYLGIKGTRGMQQFLPNTFPAGALNPCPACPAGYAYLTSNGNSTRQSGQIQLRRRLHNGFTATLNYTFSKSIDDSALGGKGQGGSLIAQNWLDLGAERGRSNFDQRHALNLQLQYTTGMGVAGGMLLRGWKGALFKQWTVSSQITSGSGRPLTPIYLAAVGRTGVTGTIRPDYTGATVHDAPAGLFLNPAAYTAPALGRWGNAGRNSITGPAQFGLNASLGRTFRMRDRINVDLRVDATNALNHVTFPTWDATITSAQFGLPNIANPMRNVRTTLRVRF